MCIAMLCSYLAAIIADAGSTSWVITLATVPVVLLLGDGQAYPLDLVRTRLAAQMSTGGYYRGIRGTLRRIVADEGVAGLYRGMGATLLQVGTEMT